MHGLVFQGDCDAEASVICFDWLALDESSNFLTARTIDAFKNWEHGLLPVRLWTEW